MTTDRSIASATTYLRRIADALERMAPASTPVPDIETDGVRIRGCKIEHGPEAVVQRRVDSGVRVEVVKSPDLHHVSVYWIAIHAEGLCWRIEAPSLNKAGAELRAYELRTALGLDRPPAPEPDIEARIAEAVREEREAVADWFDVEGLHWSAGQIRRGEHRAQERKGGE